MGDCVVVPGLRGAEMLAGALATDCGQLLRKRARVSRLVGAAQPRQDRGRITITNICRIDFHQVYEPVLKTLDGRR